MNRMPRSIIRATTILCLSWIFIFVDVVGQEDKTEFGVPDNSPAVNDVAENPEPLFVPDDATGNGDGSAPPSFEPSSDTKQQQESKTAAPAAVIEYIRLQLARIESEYTELKRKYTPDHPKVVQLERQIENLKEHLAEELQRADDSDTNTSSVEEYLRLELVKTQLEHDQLLETLGTDHPRLIASQRRIDAIKSHLAEEQARRSDPKTSVIPPGMRVVTLPMELTDNMRNLLLPGDRVDLYLPKTIKVDGDSVLKYETFIESLEVFAVSSSSDSSTIHVSVLVTATNAERLLENRNESLGLALRGQHAGKIVPADNNPESSQLVEGEAKSREVLEVQRQAAADEYQQAEAAAQSAAEEYRNGIELLRQRFQDEWQTKGATTVTQLRNVLSDAVQTAFEAQSRLQQVRLELAELNLRELRAKQTHRESLQAAIVERRTRDLITRKQNGSSLIRPNSVTAEDVGLAGTWTMVSVKGPGIISGETGLLASINGNEWTFLRNGGKDRQRYRIVIDTNVIPYRIDMIPLDNNDNEPGPYRGLIAVNSDNFTVAWAPTETPTTRPATIAERQATRFEWKRVNQSSTAVVETEEQMSDTAANETPATVSKFKESIIRITVPQHWYTDEELITTKDVSLMIYGLTTGEGLSHGKLASPCRVTGVVRNDDSPGQVNLTIRIPQSTAENIGMTVSQAIVKQVAADGGRFWLDGLSTSDKIREELETVTRLIAKHRIEWGTPLTTDLFDVVRRVRVDRDEDLNGAVTRIEELEGKYAKRRIFEGDTLTEKLLDSPPDIDDYVRRAGQGGLLVTPSRISLDSEFPYSTASVRRAREDYMPAWVSRYIDAINQKLAEVPPLEWNDEHHNMLRAIHQLLLVWSEGDEWDLATTGNLLERFVTEAIASDDPEVQRLAYSEAMLSRLAYIQGRLPDAIESSEPLDPPIVEKLTLLKRMLDNKADATWISQEHIRLSGLMQEAPYHTLRMLIVHGDITRHEDMERWIFAMSSGENYDRYRTSSKNDPHPPVDPVLMLTILESLTPNSHDMNERIALICEHHHPSRLFGRHIDEVLSGTLAYRSTVKQSLVMMYFMGSPGLRKSIARLAPGVPVEAEALEAKEVLREYRLMYFRAAYSPPCREMDVLIQDITNAHDLTVDIINITTDPQSTKEHQVNRIPALILTKQGKEVDRQFGLKTKTELQQMLASAGVPKVQPQFIDPLELVQYMQDCGRRKDFTAYMNQVSDDGLKGITGMLLQSGSFVGMFAPLSADVNEGGTMKSMSDIIEKYKTPNPPPAAVSAFQKLLQFSLMQSAFGSSTPENNKITEYIELVKQSSEMIGDKRAFCTEMMAAFDQFASAEEPDKSQEQSQTEWEITIDGDTAVATEKLPEDQDGPPSKMELTRIDGYWMVAELIGRDMFVVQASEQSDKPLIPSSTPAATSK